MKIWNRFKKAFNNYLKRLEKSNQEIFGNGTPSCCGLNSRQENRKH